jgi:hypothetical protein
MNHNDCCIVIPVYKTQPDRWETISLQQCSRVLPEYETYFAGPKGVDQEAYRQLIPESRFESFPDNAFESIDSYSRLMLDPQFYSRFEQYHYMLLHQTDAFLFRNDLRRWCETGYDYIGAPFPLNGLSHPEPDWIVGNGGLSLRKVSAALQVLTTHRKIRHRSAAELYQTYKSAGAFSSPRSVLGFLTRVMGFRNSLGHCIDQYSLHEDIFWSCEAPRCPEFKIPELSLAAQFAVETHPEYWCSQIPTDLPSGCHAWRKYAFDFWAPHIERLGYTVET